MLRIKIFSPLLHQQTVLHKSIRGVRGGVTIPLQLVKPHKPPKERKFSFSDKEFRRIKKEDCGIAHAYRRRIEEKYDVDGFDDPEEFHDSDIAPEETGDVFTESHKIAESGWKTKSFFNIKRRHFKSPKLPNMLTYIEKKQIKSLHKKDSDYWNHEKLASCFPASPEIIKKVLRSKFVAYDVATVQKHDNVVRKNWDLFRQNKLKFDKDLSDHYTMFLNRMHFETNPKEIEKFLPSPPEFCKDLPHKEFGSIISSAKKYRLLAEEKNMQIEKDEHNRLIYARKAEEYKVIDEDELTRFHKLHLTLDEFRSKLFQNQLPATHDVDVVIKKSDPKNMLAAQKKIAEDNSQDYDYLNDSQGVINKHLRSKLFENRNYDIPLRVNVPKKYLSKDNKDKVFRVKDCFYNNTGYFLYRVPGLY